MSMISALAFLLGCGVTRLLVRPRRARSVDMLAARRALREARELAARAA